MNSSVERLLSHLPTDRPWPTPDEQSSPVNGPFSPVCRPSSWAARAFIDGWALCGPQPRSTDSGLAPPGKSSVMVATASQT
ncbi:MAG: hypothetical protein KDA57_23210, partial [Planctomycetales bacterium]|nr:hypothetical protein [Planctomycetales bacterium]